MPQPLRRLRRHLPMNGEEPFLHLNAAAPPAPSAPPPHEWEPLRRLRRHLPMNGEEPFLHLLKGGKPGCPSLLVGRDFWVVAFHQGDLVETFQQAITREWVDLEAVAASVAAHLLRL